MFLMSKETRINVRTSPKIKDELQITADLRGLTVSALVNTLVVKAVREEKEREPKAFENNQKIRGYAKIIGRALEVNVPEYDEKELEKIKDFVKKENL